MSRRCCFCGRAGDWHYKRALTGGDWLCFDHGSCMDAVEVRDSAHLGLCAISAAVTMVMLAHLFRDIVRVDGDEWESVLMHGEDGGCRYFSYAQACAALGVVP